MKERRLNQLMRQHIHIFNHFSKLIFTHIIISSANQEIRKNINYDDNVHIILEIPF